MPRQGRGLCESLLSPRRPQAGWVKGAAPRPLPRQRGPKQWAFVPVVGGLSRCAALALSPGLSLHTGRGAGPGGLQGPGTPQTRGQGLPETIRAKETGAQRRSTRRPAPYVHRRQVGTWGTSLRLPVASGFPPCGQGLGHPGAEICRQGVSKARILLVLSSRCPHITFAKGLSQKPQPLPVSGKPPGLHEP